MNRNSQNRFSFQVDPHWADDAFIAYSFWLDDQPVIIDTLVAEANRLARENALLKQQLSAEKRVTNMISENVQAGWLVVQ